MDIFRKPKHVKTKWASFENLTCKEGKGGLENSGAKGHAYESVSPGEEKILLDISDSGIINRIWITVSDRSPEMMRPYVHCFATTSAADV